MRPESCTIDELITLFKGAGIRNVTSELIERHIEEGAPVHEDGTLDLFDYAAWLVGTPSDDTRIRVPPTEIFDIEEVNPTRLAGWLSMYNHMNYDVSRNKIGAMFQEFNSRLKSRKNEKSIDFVKFVAFCATRRKSGGFKPKTLTAAGYDAHRAEMARRSAAQSAEGRDIGEIPKPAHPEQIEACREDFKLFCETYFPELFSLGWSDDHLRVIEKIEQSVLRGGLFALALPRGSGKTSLCETACIWAVLYGHRKFICLIGATETAADEMLASIKVELETNELLQEDFPSACYPVACLEGIAARCNGQTCNGERTRIKWTNNELVLPTIKGSVSSGIIIRVTGILGRIRGMKFKRPDGKSVRPDLVIIDDPQTRESASSIEQNRKRLQTLNGDILGLAGPSKKISGIMPCTVIRSGDMADTILDATKNPEWNGEKAKMLYVMPKNMKLWEEYNAIREESLRNDGNFEMATQFYIENREAMDEGAVVGWKERFNHDEVSALQNAMNLLFRDEVSFAAEYQNEPLSENIGDENVLSADFIAGKLNGIRYLTIPLDATCLTMFVDVQKTALFYTIMAFSDTFSGYVIDYGTYPEQQSRRYTLASLRTKLSDVFPNAGLEGQLYSALNHLLDEQLEKVYLREDGTPMKLNFSMIDANWGESTNIVYQVCRLDKWNGRVMPSHGHFVGASSKPMSEYRKKAGEKLGLEWYIPNANGRAIRHVVWNTNYWKSFVMARLAVAMGDNGCFSLYGNSPMTHEMYSEHMTAEYSVRVQGRGRIVDEWRIRPEHNDNHFFDCTVGCAVCASIIGCSLPEQNKLVEAAKQQKFSFTTDANGRIERKVQEVPLPVETAHEPPLAQKPQAISLKQLYAKKHGRPYKPH